MDVLTTSRSTSSRVSEQTRSLFTYHRDDHTPGHLTTVRIDTAHTAGTAISPFVFGNFIEHLGGVVYQGLWAQALLNPNLERISQSDTMPPEWKLDGRAAWVSDGYRSPAAVRLPPGAAGGANAEDTGNSALTQIVRLPLRRTRRYMVHLYARATEGAGSCRISLEDRQEKRQFGGATATISKAEWQPLQITLMLPPEAVTAGPELVFKIAHESGMSVDVDQIELFPDDSLAGIDADVLNRARAWHIPVLRWPGGNFASGYHWQDGIGPREQRPTRPNAAWGGIEPNHFGTDEFLAFCRTLGAQPQITVNAGDGTPEEAAAWVRYCNSPAGDRYGRMRAENGITQPYDVRVWEVGNELYGDWQIGHTDPQGNASRYVRFRDAMLKADPRIKLIATGKGEEFTPEGLLRDLTWNRALLQAATADGAAAPDYLSIHPLVPLPYLAGGASYEEQYESAMAQPAFLDETLLPDLACLIQSVVGPHAPTRIAVTEWGLIVGGGDWRNSPNHDTLAGAIFNALTLNAMLRNSDWVRLANMTAFMHGGGIKKWNGVVYVDPQYYTQQLYAAARPHAPVETIMTGPGRDVPARGGLPAVENVPDVDTFAALTEDGKRLVVFAVNRNLSGPRPLRLELHGFQARSVSATLLTAPTPKAGNSWDAPDVVRPRPFEVPASLSTKRGIWQATLPPHALVVFTFTRAGSRL